MQETWVRSLGWEDPLEWEMATHCSILAWRIPTDSGAWRATVRAWGHKDGHPICAVGHTHPHRGTVARSSGKRGPVLPVGGASSLVKAPPFPRDSRVQEARLGNVQKEDPFLCAFMGPFLPPFSPPPPIPSAHLVLLPAKSCPLPALPQALAGGGGVGMWRGCARGAGGRGSGPGGLSLAHEPALPSGRRERV